MKPLHLVMGGALALAAWLGLFGDKRPDSGIAEPVTRTVKVARAAATAGAVRTTSAGTPTNLVDADAVLAVQPRAELLGGQSTTASALFGTHSWEPPPQKVVPQKALPPPRPTAPVLPFTYLGKKAEDGAWEVYLARGEQTYIVREHALLEGVYRVETIKPPLLYLTYLPLKQMQTLSIGGAE